MSNNILVFGVSDMTGETVSRVVRAASAQFSQGSVSILVLAHATSARQVLDFVEKHREASASCAVFHTILNPQMREDLRNALQTQGIASIDLLGMPAHVMADLLGTRPTTTPGITIADGKTLDTAKGVAHCAGISDMIVPTAASTDAPCSRLAVVYTEDHEFDHYMPLNANPSAVVVDTDVIAHAPVRFLMAGIGDAMATWYEADACRRSSAVTMVGGHVSLGALALAALCRDTLLADGLQAKAAAQSHVVTPALENVIEANTYLSSIGFESSGLAAAHAIHDGLTSIEATHKYLHGEKVAFGTVCQLVLENKPMEELSRIVTFLHACDLPVCLRDLGISECPDGELLEAAKGACAPGDTMGNMPFEVTPEDVVAAMRTTDALAELILK